MSKSNEAGEGLAALLADALIEDTLEADLLLRYAGDPEALEPTERERVDRYLAASPAHRQQLRSLVRFAEARSELVAEARSKFADGSGEATVTAISSHPRWRARAALIAGAVAASLLAALLYGMQGGLGTSGQPAARLAVEDSSTSEPRRPSAGFVPVPETAPKLPAREEPTQLAQSEDEVVERLAPSLVTDAAPAIERVLAEAASPPDPVPVPVRGQQAEPDGVPVEAGTREPILLAMNVSGPLVYERPESAIELAFLGGLRDVRPGLSRLQALAPSHVAWTLSESPSLYWYLSEDTDRPVKVVLADRVSVDPLLDLRLEPPLGAGIHVVHLAAHDVVLDPGQEYRWFVSLSADAGSATEGVVTRGAVLRIEPAAELVEALEGSPFGEHGRIYAERGLWYDAVAYISAGIDRDPEDTRLRELRAGLLEGGGLSEVADHDRRVSGLAPP